MSLTLPAAPAALDPGPLNGHRLPTEPSELEAPALGRLGAGWLSVIATVGVMAAFVALGGMVLSFRAVSAEMTGAFGGWSWLVPVVIDLSVFVFSGVDLVLARLDMGHPLARWTVYGATLGTVYLNFNAGGTLPGRVAHVLMPSIWVIFIELMRHIVRRKVNLATGSHREPIPAARWLLAPWSTAKLWRRMVLWQVHSYTAALATERRRLAAIAAVREEHGVMWRRKVSPLLRMQIAMGELGAESIRTLTHSGQNAATEAANPSASGGQPSGQSSAKPAAIKRPARGQSTAGKVAALAAKNPAITAAEVAKRLGIGERTARRYLTGK